LAVTVRFGIFSFRRLLNA